MEGRQRIEQDVGLIKLQMLACLFDIGKQIGMRQRYALRLALGAGREQDHRRTVGRGTARDEAGDEGADRRERLVDDRQLLANVLEIDDTVIALELLDQRLQLAEGDEALGGDDAFHLGGVERAFQAGGAGREI